MAEVMTQTTTPKRSRTPYEMPASTRMGLIEKGKLEPSPVLVGLGLRNVVMNSRIELGRFETAESAVLFGWCGVLRSGKISATEILKIGAGRSGFACMRALNEQHISELLSSHRLLTNVNQSKHELNIYDIDSSGFECEVDTSLLDQFRN